jgi:hypothetical protein
MAELTRRPPECAIGRLAHCGHIVNTLGASCWPLSRNLAQFVVELRPNMFEGPPAWNRKNVSACCVGLDGHTNAALGKLYISCALRDKADRMNGRAHNRGPCLPMSQQWRPETGKNWNKTAFKLLLSSVVVAAAAAAILLKEENDKEFGVV